MNKEFLKNLVSVVREAKDYSITFTFTLNSKNWYFEEKSGTDTNPKETKEILLEDLKQSLYRILDDEDESEILSYCTFKEE